MADDITSALLGLEDLSAFSNQAQQNNLWSQIGPSVIGAGQQFNRSTWTPTESFATNLLTSFLGGAMMRYGQKQVADQTRSVASILPQIYEDPLNVTAPEGVDNAAFENLRSSSVLKNLQRRSLMEQMMQKTNMDMYKTLFSEEAKAGAEAKYAGPKAKAQELGKLEAFDALNGADAKGMPTNPDDPRYKRMQDIGKIEREYTEKLLTGTQANQVLNINKAAKNILEATKKDNPLAASTAIFEYAKLQDPIGTVREADEMRVSDPGGPLGRLAQVYNEIQQKGKLTADGKKYLRELVPILQKNSFESYNQLKNNYLQATADYGGDPSRVKFVTPEDLTPLLQDGGVVGGATMETLTAIRDKMKDPALSFTERQALAAQARELVTGNKVSTTGSW